MNRRQFCKSSLFASGAFLLPIQNTIASPLFEGKNIKILRGNIGTAIGGGGTMGWFMDKESSVIVDTQNPKSAKAMIQKIKSETTQKIDYIVNTHHHPDHIGGNTTFKAMANNLIAHKNCSDFQKSGKKRKWTPTLEFTDTWSKRVGSEILTLHHFGAAHTSGDAIVHFENTNIVHAGDVIWHKRGPRIDHNGGCNVMNWIKVLSKMEQHFDKDTLYMFGHGNNSKNISGDVSFLIEFREYLENTVTLVEQKHKKGYSLQEILAIKKVPGSENWPYSERTLKGVYAEVTGKIPPISLSEKNSTNHIC